MMKVVCWMGFDELFFQLCVTDEEYVKTLEYLECFAKKEMGRI